MTTTLFWGDNGVHEFWESEDQELLILRNHHEQFWSAHRNHGFLFSCGSALEGATKLDAELCQDRVWKRQPGGRFVLVNPNAWTKD
jgi:hypothetical protein